MSVSSAVCCLLSAVCRVQRQKAMAGAKLHLAEPSPHSPASSQEARKRRAATQQAAPPGLARAPTANLLDWIRGGGFRETRLADGQGRGLAVNELGASISILSIFFFYSFFFLSLRTCAYVSILLFVHIHTCVLAYPYEYLLPFILPCIFSVESHTHRYVVSLPFSLPVHTPIHCYSLTTCLIAMSTTTPSRIQTHRVPTPLCTV
ncbi:uncharacterized protein BDZ83DRAFT_74003 [Colletotrichum acutatum]|uniref:Uncharacterized protein n=1 Tax=Glomerella acutata TaxID=27357 RepID=A0AAD8UE83_GLOAC|nr:uncharacterized protein BDZ83DRAFT_74003 [Colletotrichum acutatum]KAK1714115.1 hypothetical protein BDZ83DRAFT_74003 [Colletotrichum acutatum]